jgi:rare lipoprotein A
LRTITIAAHFAAWGLFGAIACAAEQGAEISNRRSTEGVPVGQAQLVDVTGTASAGVGAATQRRSRRDPPNLTASVQTGVASVYGGDRHRGSKTANGERVQPAQLTAAHRSLPFGTRVRVTNVGNGQSVVVRINDRGPFVRGRIIDVTPAAARALGFSDLARVSVSIAGTDN